MRVVPTDLAGAFVIETDRIADNRGHFVETWHRRRYADLGIPAEFAQDNVSGSIRGVLRGLHFQTGAQAQGKLVSVQFGAVYDVIVDLRLDSPTFGTWAGLELSSENGWQLWVPEGFAHGFVATSDVAVFHYKCTQYYARESERSIRWNDPDLAIEWPIPAPILSAKDASAPLLAETDHQVFFSTRMTSNNPIGVRGAVDAE